MSFHDADMMSIETHTFDTEPLYEWLREEEPLFWDKENELWAVSRYDDIMFVSKHPELFCSGEGVVPNLGPETWPDEAMINKDGDEHTKQRALISRGFTPRRVSGLEPKITEIVESMISSFAARGKADLVTEFARPFPFQVISHMLGYKGNQDRVLDWTDTFAHAGCGIDYVTEEVIDAFANFVEFHEGFLAEKKACPGEDLLSIWLAAEIDGERLSEDKLMYEHSLLLVGGAETTRSAIALGVKALLENPDQYTFLVERLDDADVVANAVEELIRWSSPFVRMRRTATQDVELHGKTIKEGQQIIMLYPAANRDPRVFDEPQKFDLQRDFTKPSLSFGYGKHYCLGASLARLEARIALVGILRRLPGLALDPNEEIVPHASSFVNALHHLPVVFEAQ